MVAGMKKGFGLGLATEWIEIRGLRPDRQEGKVSVLRPSGLKYFRALKRSNMPVVSVLRPSGLKYDADGNAKQVPIVSVLRPSGLKYRRI